MGESFGKDTSILHPDPGMLYTGDARNEIRKTERISAHALGID